MAELTLRSNKKGTNKITEMYFKARVGKGNFMITRANLLSDLWQAQKSYKEGL